MLRILDTDHVSVFQRGGSNAALLRERLLAEGGQVAVTVVTMEEQLRGLLLQIRRAEGADAEVKAHERLLTAFRFYERWTILPWTSESAEEFGKLWPRRTRIGTMDLRIASIALANEAVVLTRNLRDFQQVPGLRVENWLD